jgi:hypothetical protein
MFSTTFLGHQGWIFQAARSCVLVDPLLCEEFGRIHALDYQVHPPRVLNKAEFPKVDAVILTHEHDDHFDIPSLYQIDRRIPIFLSSRSSTAAFRIVRDMGFAVHPLKPGMLIRFDDLELLPFCGDLLRTACGDEWDTLPFLIYDTAGDGSFFSMVDCTLTQAHLERVKERLPRPGLITWTNNALDWSHLTDFVPKWEDGTAEFTQRMLAGHHRISSIWGTPSAMLLCAGGFSFVGAREWLNRTVFCVDGDKVCKAMRAAYANQRFYPTRPGQTFHMDKGQLKKVDSQQPFLSTVPAASWPNRTKTSLKEVPDYAPACGRQELAESERELLEHRLAELARALVGTPLFKGLYSLLDAEVGQRIPSFALALRNGSPLPAWVYGYNPSACSFERRDAVQPRDLYLAGMECWGTDLLAILNGELGPIALNFGRARFWNALPKRWNFDPIESLHAVSHPLSRPAEYFQLYERQLRSCTPAPPAPFILPR